MALTSPTRGKTGPLQLNKLAVRVVSSRYLGVGPRWSLLALVSISPDIGALGIVLTLPSLDSVCERHHSAF